MRRLFGLARPIGKAEAIAAARAYAQARGWPWQEPIVVEAGLREYRIRTNASRRGGNVNVRVSMIDGTVRFASFAER